MARGDSVRVRVRIPRTLYDEVTRAQEEFYGFPNLSFLMEESLKRTMIAYRKYKKHRNEYNSHKPNSENATHPQ